MTLNDAITQRLGLEGEYSIHLASSGGGWEPTCEEGTCEMEIPIEHTLTVRPLIWEERDITSPLYDKEPRMIKVPVVDRTRPSYEVEFPSIPAIWEWLESTEPVAPYVPQPPPTPRRCCVNGCVPEDQLFDDDGLCGACRDKRRLKLVK